MAPKVYFMDYSSTFLPVALLLARVKLSVKKHFHNINQAFNEFNCNQMLLQHNGKGKQLFLRLEDTFFSLQFFSFSDVHIFPEGFKKF